MKYGRIISILLCFMFVVSSPITGRVSAADASYEQDIMKLMENLNIVESGTSVNLNKNITRGEAVKYIVRTMITGGASAKGETSYHDVADNEDLSSYINFAQSMGIISEANNFNPNDYATFEEVLKMILCGLGYEIVAQDKGGYPTGYIFAAQSAEIKNPANLQIGDQVTYSQLFMFLKDALTANLCQKNYGAEQEWTITNKTLLSSIYGVEILKNAQVLSVNDNDHTASIQGDNILTLDLPINYQNQDMVDILTNIWYDKNEKSLVFLDILKSYQIRYDYITAVNGNEDSETELYPEAIKRIELYSDNKKYSVHSKEFKVRHNGVEGADETVALVNTFARIVFKDGLVCAIESYNLTEGGFITNISPTRITYARGSEAERYIDKMDSTDNIRTVLDGKLADWKKLSTKYLIDYFQSDDMIFILASSYQANGNLDSSSGEELIIDGVHYNMDNMFGKVYFSDQEGVQYDTNSGKLTNLYNSTVTAYLDIYGRVRYLTGAEDLSSTVIGLITHIEKGAFGVSSINVYADHNGTVGVKKFDVKLSKRSEVTEKHLERLNDIDNAVFEFTTNGKQVKYIENIDWLVCDPAKKKDIKDNENTWLLKLYGDERIAEVRDDENIFLAGATWGKDSGLGRMNFHTLAADGTPFERITNIEGTQFIAAYDSYGDLNPSILEWWADFRNGWVDRMFIKVGFSKDNIDRTTPDIVYILSSPRWIHTRWETFGIITELSKMADDRYMMEIMEPDPKRTKYIVNGDDIIGEKDGKIPKQGDPVWLDVRGYYERINYNAAGEIISDEDADKMEEEGDYVRKEETYQANGYARVLKTIDLLNEVGTFDNDNCITYVDNIYKLEGSTMFYQDTEKGLLMPIRTDTEGRNLPIAVEGPKKYLMIDYEDFIDQRWEMQSFDSLHTIKKNGYSDKLYIFTVNQGRFPKIVIRMPQDHLPGWQ